MKPEQFIREFGLEAIKDCIEEAEAYGGFYVNAKTLELSKHIPSYDAVSITALMRLVESLGRIAQRGGLSKTKDHLDYLISFGSEFAGVSKEEIKELQQDVANYESIYGGVHES
ncbi:hypothetical protein [Acinetobacter lactucae]|uniref:hypothetical protein n=1 Tax=Acinetobacter lactucae TaxID=1785128 RepID=UPI0015F37EEB|nr:hypothetical protein [Acinetobacter lactucae]